MLASTAVHGFVAPFARTVPRTTYSSCQRQYESALLSSKQPLVVKETSAENVTGGPVQVDMNQYNLPMEQAIEEWTANLVAESATMSEGVYLGAKNSRQNFVDSVKISGIPRKPGQGLGIELLEIAGGREDGLGITIASGLVKGGLSEGKGILPGDSIAKISVLKEGSDEPIASVDTEALGWDATVEQIGSLPSPSENDDEYLIITVKRLRRKPKVTVNFQYPPDMGEEDMRIELFSGENLRRAMLVRGVKLNDPLSRRFDSGGTGDCGAEGTCATCVVAVTEGDDLLNDQKIQEAQMLAKNPRWRLACKAIVGYGMKEGQMTVKVNPRQWN